MYPIARTETCLPTTPRQRDVLGSEINGLERCLIVNSEFS